MKIKPILKILEKLGLKKKPKTNICKEDMCRKSISFGICPGICEKCAWGNMSESDIK